MKEMPELWELEAIFETEAIDVYGEEKAIPWFYRTINSKLTRESETLDITISPSDGCVDIWILSGERKIVSISFENVLGMRIEKMHNKEILNLLLLDNSSIEKCYIETKPNILVFCMAKQSYGIQ